MAGFRTLVRPAAQFLIAHQFTLVLNVDATIVEALVPPAVLASIAPLLAQEYKGGGDVSAAELFGECPAPTLHEGCEGTLGTVPFVTLRLACVGVV